MVRGAGNSCVEFLLEGGELLIKGEDFCREGMLGSEMLGATNARGVIRDSDLYGFHLRGGGAEPTISLYQPG